MITSSVHPTKALGIDVGGSATRWSLSEGQRIASGCAAGFSGHLSKSDILQRAENVLQQISAETGDVDCLVAGVTGLSKETPEARQLTHMLGERFKASKIVVMSDIELGTRAAFEPGQGILVYAGTGSIAAHLSTAEVLHTAGGKGVLIDDAGGGYWIAIRAMRAILRAEDTRIGSGWSTMLGQALAARLGGTDWPHVRTAFYALDRGGIALLAIAVGDTARAGDQTALAILEAAGRELALLGQMLANRLKIYEIAVAGRASTLHEIIVKTMQDALPGYTMKGMSLDAAKTAMNMAHHLHDLENLRPN